MRIEISQAKKEATDFSLKVDRSEKMKILEKGENESNLNIPAVLPFPQKKTEEEYIKNKKSLNNKHDDMDILKTLFS